MSFEPSQPETEEAKLHLPAAGLEVGQFTEYSFGSNFLTPTDGWSFTVAADRWSPELKAALVPGAPVKLSINGLVQSSGFIDSIEKTASRGSGVEWRIEGRDRLAQAVDACADPMKSLKESMTLLDGMKLIFGPFGWDSDEQFVDSNAANKELKTGGQGRAKRKTSDKKGFGRRAIKAYKLHQFKPYEMEGVFAFAARIAQRFGLWIWSSADGEQLIIAEPNFDDDPLYSLYRRFNGETNILEGSVKLDLAEQPTHIITDTHTKAGEFGHGRGKIVMANSLLRLPNDEVPADVKKYLDAGAREIKGPTFPETSKMLAPRPRVVFINDGESATIEHLENFARREMALAQRKSLTVSYTVEGHGQMTSTGFTPWTVDATVDVDDEVADLRERLYVLGRTFNKSRSSGTTTHLELIRLNTLVFSDTGK